jgi:hypothetical protein
MHYKAVKRSQIKKPQSEMEFLIIFFLEKEIFRLPVSDPIKTFREKMGKKLCGCLFFDFFFEE